VANIIILTVSTNSF